MIVIICGMHRSGTSALAGMLHANKICMGDERKKDFYPPPMKENPKGFYENVRFRRVNDAILKRVGYSVKSFDSYIPEVPICSDVKIRGKMKELITEFDSTNVNWGWKDPRTSLTLLTWVDVLKTMDFYRKAKAIFIVRDPDEIAESMLARGNKEKVEGQFKSLALQYMFRAVVCLSDTGMPFTPIAFGTLIRHPEDVAENLSSFLGAEITDTSFIDPEIARTIA